MKKEQIIFSEISELNPTLSHSSSLGDYVSDSSRMVSEDIYKKIIKSIPENSLAYQILTNTDHYSEKQLWVITFELLKNENYCNEIMEEFYERNSREFEKIEVMTENKQKDKKEFDYNGGSGSNLKYRDWDILEDLPEGWIIDKFCGSPLYGFVFCTNGKSILNGGKRALMRAFINIRGNNK